MAGHLKNALREILRVYERSFLQPKSISGTSVMSQVSRLLFCSVMLPSLLNSIQSNHQHATNKPGQVLKQNDPIPGAYAL